MIIYKITNKLNGKVYIGQTINSLEARWKRHQNDALHYILDTHFARAIRYYGPENFVSEIIDTANTQEELNQKQHDWIEKYNSIQEGYNETSAITKSGGNTYQNKTPKQMAIIKEKLSKSKQGGLNPHSTKVKCKNVNTNEEYHFQSQAEMQAFFNENNHQFCSRRCLHQIKLLYKNEWLISYENDPYITDYSFQKCKSRKGNQLKIILTDGNEKIYKSYRAAEQDLPINRKTISDIARGIKPQRSDFKIELL